MYLGHDKNDEKIVLASTDLLTHGVVLGRTGSGKTGLTISLIEEAAGTGASVVVLDPKGDLANLALSLSSAGDFRNWADENARLTHGAGLAEFDLGFEHVEYWRDHCANVKIYCPGLRQHGVNIFPSFARPVNPSREAAARGVNTVLRAITNSDDPYDPAAVYLTEAVTGSWVRGRPLPVGEWPAVLTDPPDEVSTIGGMRLEEFYPRRIRLQLARRLIGFWQQSERWMSGSDFDLHSHVNWEDKPNVAVFTMRHLSEEDRKFFAGLFLHKVQEFMSETPSADYLKLLVCLDEARGYLPPHPLNPPTKEPICTILAQGRAHGIGMLIGTQSPMDLDYKALGNVGTWFVGRLRERDCVRDLAAELANRGVTPERVTGLQQRRFLLMDKRGRNTDLRTRQTFNFLFGPMGPEHISCLP